MAVSRRSPRPKRDGTVLVTRPARAGTFRVVFFENRDFKPGGDTWILTENGWQGKVPPNDEIAAFKLTGDPGVVIELFDDKKPNKRKTWGEVVLTTLVTKVDVPNLKKSTSTYVHHQAPGEPTLDGRVSLIQAFA